MKTLIIAEAGVNHNGRMDLAKRLVDAASTAGANFIKFQAFKSKNLVTRNLDKANYQKKGGKPSESQYEMLKKLELSQNELTELFTYCSKKKIKFMASAFDKESLRFILNMDIEYLKVPSGEITNIPYLRLLGRNAESHNNAAAEKDIYSLLSNWPVYWPLLNCPIGI